MSKLKILFGAIKEKNVEKVKKQLTEDLSLTGAVDEDGWSTIHVCAASGNKEIMKLLIDEFGANVNERTEHFYTPIHLAARSGNLECLKELLSHGADLDLTNRNHMNVIDFLAEVFPSVQDAIELNCNNRLCFETESGDLKLVGESEKYNFELNL